MSYQTSTILKLTSVKVSQNVLLGDNELRVVKPINIFLPAGTLLESGNVRIPYDLVDDQNITLNNLNENTAGLVENSDCNNQNIIFFSDSDNNNIYSNIPIGLSNIPAGSPVCYTKVPKDTDLQMNLNQCDQKIDIKLNKDLWTTLNKGTKIKILKDTQVEFRVNGSWHRIKLIKDELFKI